MQSQQDKELFAEVLEFCNRVRRANGAVEIEKLINGFVDDPQYCVVANSVNCGLAVSGINNSEINSGFIGWALFASTHKAHVALMKVAKEFNEDIVYRVPNGWEDAEGKHIVPAPMPSLLVPKAVATLAQRFDYGHYDSDLFAPFDMRRALSERD